MTAQTQGPPIEVATEVNNAGAAPAPAPKKKYVRVITDKRREQNRRAQKAYKDRLKRKLEELEGRAQSTAGAQDASSANVQPTPVTGRLRQVPAASVQHASSEATTDSQHTSSTQPTSPDNSDLIEPVYSSTSVQAQSNPDPHVINLGDAFVAAGDLPFATGSVPGLAFLGQDLSTTAPTPKSFPDTENEIGHDAGLVHHHVHENYGELDLRHIWALPPRSPWQNYTPSGKKDKKRSSTGSATALIRAPRSQSSYYSSPGGIGINSGPRSTSTGISMPVPIPDPYANHMRLWAEDNIEAAIAIALTIGISRSEYINDHPSRFPGCYVALNRPRDNAVARPVKYMFDGAGQGWRNGMEVTKELSEHMDLVKPALRPTPGQLLEPHPSYLDCIVFPWFREHAVRASVAGKLDHVELFMDIMNGGLVCWGAGSGMAGRIGKRGVGKRGMQESVAWDTRSWEARRWFLKKWEWLVGTEEDEERRGDVFGIWRGSRWWWRMRGEDDESEDDEDAEADEVQEESEEGIWETAGVRERLCDQQRLSEI